MESLFAKELNRRLLEYYGRVPAASILARDFNLRANGITPITQESARRWMRGLSLPENNKLQILVEWFDIDTNLIFP